MIQRLLYFTLAFGLVFALPAFAQDCGSKCGSKTGETVVEKKQGCGGSCGDQCGDSCEGACSVDPNSALSVRVAQIEKAAAKGCEKCGARVVALREMFGADNEESVSGLIASYETSAKGGCEASCESIDKAEAYLKANACKPAPLSDRVAALAASSEKGCAKSGEKLAAFQKSCGSDCNMTIIAKIREIEASADKGCKTSAYKLAVLDARFAGQPDPKAPLSLRVAMMTEYAGKGCEVSSTTLKAIEAEFSAEENKNLVATLETLETKAANGCKECVAKLVVVESKMPVMKSAKSAKKSCSDCKSGCSDCDEECETGCESKKADCCGSCDSEKSKADCGSGCDTEKPKSGCGGCPSEKKQNA
jgi:hypothetical protein